MLSLVITIVCFVCYCCHRNIKKRTASVYRQQWFETDGNMEIYSVEQVSFIYEKCIFFFFHHITMENFIQNIKFFLKLKKMKERKKKSENMYVCLTYLPA